MKSLMQKSATLVLTGIIGLCSVSASASATLDDVTDYYLYNTLVQTEFELDNHLVEQIATTPQNIEQLAATSLMAMLPVEEETVSSDAE